LIAAASEAVGTDEVQVVVLNDATPLLRHRVLRDGVQLVDRDPRTRIRLEAAALLEYLDTAPLRATLAAGLRHRDRRGAFWSTLRAWPCGAASWLRSSGFSLTPDTPTTASGRGHI